MIRALQHRWVPISIGVWVAAIAWVLGLLWTYANVAGSSGGLPVGWAPPPELDRPDDRPMLVLFAHSRCPCTRATMAAVERLQRDAQIAFATRVVIYEPVAADSSWRRTELWKRAGRLADAKGIPDPGGAISAGAGATTSGCVALLDQDGGLLFWGGITPSRGHEGESIGLAAIRSLLRGHVPKHQWAPAYGCDMIGSNSDLSDCGGIGACNASSSL